MCVLSQNIYFSSAGPSQRAEGDKTLQRGVLVLSCRLLRPANIFNYCLYSRRSTATDHLTNLIRCLARDYDLQLSVLRGRLQNLLLDAPECGDQIVETCTRITNTGWFHQTREIRIVKELMRLRKGLLWTQGGAGFNSYFNYKERNSHFRGKWIYISAWIERVS